jgi:ABC-type multidrug transport system ATPase subunit
VKEEKLKVASKPNLPLVVSAVEKKYPISNGKKDYVAVKSISFTIRENEIFGLLGPNGAGKTSLISVLTGLYPATSGDAWLQGLSIRTEIDKIRMSIGVCPQFDLLWR